MVMKIQSHVDRPRPCSFNNVIVFVSNLIKRNQANFPPIARIDKIILPSSWVSVIQKKMNSSLRSWSTLSSDVKEICVRKCVNSRKVSYSMNMPNKNNHTVKDVQDILFDFLLSYITISHLLRVCHGTRCDTWSERFNTVAVSRTTMTSASSIPLPKCGSVRICLDLLSTSTRATASQNAPVSTSIWHTFRWVTARWMIAWLYTFVSGFYK